MLSLYSGMSITWYGRLGKGIGHPDKSYPTSQAKFKALR